MTNSVPVTRAYHPERAHPFLSSKFKRRDPALHFYLPIECPSLKGCPDGSCPLAHTKLEVIFHPIVYKTRQCRMSVTGQCAFSKKCTFYNNDAEKTTAQLMWLIWENTWDLWRHNIEMVLLNHSKLSNGVTKLLPVIKNYRGNLQQFLTLLTEGAEGGNALGVRLGSILREQFVISRENLVEHGGENPCMELLTSSTRAISRSASLTQKPRDVFYDWFFNYDVELLTASVREQSTGAPQPVETH
ncbi:erythrocyte membrane protein [Babesia caballi]|uniref:Erythrocyte membrane protein n=1 Tax=Babesia caballi TaxID=5871 RepID=A0AAV4LS10_BABCB|nr:erythrocyte membrane protein [Babesia caballi]